MKSMQPFRALFALPASLWSDRPLWLTANLPLVNIPWTACMCNSDPRLQREAEPRKGIKPNRMAGYRPCLSGQPGLHFSPWVLVVHTESNFIDRVCVRHHHVEAILQEKERENRMWSVNTRTRTYTHTISMICVDDECSTGATGTW